MPPQARVLKPAKNSAHLPHGLQRSLAKANLKKRDEPPPREHGAAHAGQWPAMGTQGRASDGSKKRCLRILVEGLWFQETLLPPARRRFRAAGPQKTMAAVCQATGRLWAGRVHVILIYRMWSYCKSGAKRVKHLVDFSREGTV
jgi:hypothetical protein